jgi:hypothetical protein
MAVPGGALIPVGGWVSDTLGELSVDSTAGLFDDDSVCGVPGVFGSAVDVEEGLDVSGMGVFEGSLAVAGTLFVVVVPVLLSAVDGVEAALLVSLVAAAFMAD